MYYGKTLEVIPFLVAQDFAEPEPGENPADWVLCNFEIQAMEAEDKKGGPVVVPPDDADDDEAEVQLDDDRIAQPPIATQLLLLLYMEALKSKRNMDYLFKCVTFFGFAFLFCSVLFQSDLEDYDDQVSFSILLPLFVTLNLFTPLASIPDRITQRVDQMSEITIPFFPRYMAAFLWQVVIILIGIFPSYSIIYWTCGFRADASFFFYFILCTSMLIIYATSIGTLTSSLTNNATIAMSMYNVIVVIFDFFCAGFSVVYSDLPWHLRWMWYIGVGHHYWAGLVYSQLVPPACKREGVFLYCFDAVATYQLDEDGVGSQVWFRFLICLGWSTFFFALAMYVNLRASRTGS